MKFYNNKKLPQWIFRKSDPHEVDFSILAVADIIMSLVFLATWLFLWWGYSYYGISDIKLYNFFGLFVLCTIETVFARIKFVMNLDIWMRCILHCSLSVVIITLYIFILSSTPWFYSILFNIEFMFWTIIRYCYENNQYYGE